MDFVAESPLAIVIPVYNGSAIRLGPCRCFASSTSTCDRPRGRRRSTDGTAAYLSANGRRRALQGTGSLGGAAASSSAAAQQSTAELARSCSGTTTTSMRRRTASSSWPRRSRPVAAAPCRSWLGDEVGGRRRIISAAVRSIAPGRLRLRESEASTSLRRRAANASGFRVWRSPFRATSFARSAASTRASRSTERR